MVLNVHRNHKAYDGRGRGGGGEDRVSGGSTARSDPERPRRPWTTARTTAVGTSPVRSNYCSVQLLFQLPCGAVTMTMSVAQLLRND